MHAIYHDKDSKTTKNDYLLAQETVYKDIHIRIDFKQLATRRVYSNSDWLQIRTGRGASNEGNTPTIT